MKTSAKATEVFNWRSGPLGVSFDDARLQERFPLLGFELALNETLAVEPLLFETDLYEWGFGQPYAMRSRTSVLLSAKAAKRSSSVSAKPPEDPWKYIGRGHYGHHVGMIDEETADLPPMTPVDAAAKRHDEEYGDIQSRYTWSEGDSPTSVWFENYYKIDDPHSATMHLEFIYSDLALAWRTVFNIGAGLFDGSYDLTMAHGPQGWLNLFSDLFVAGFFTFGVGVIGYAVLSAAVHVVGFVASVAYQVVTGIYTGIGQMAEGLGDLGRDIGGGLSRGWKQVGADVSREAKAFGGDVSREWKNAGGAISSGWKKAGGSISSGWKKATGGVL